MTSCPRVSHLSIPLFFRQTADCVTAQGLVPPIPMLCCTENLKESTNTIKKGLARWLDNKVRSINKTQEYFCTLATVKTFS